MSETNIEAFHRELLAACAASDTAGGRRIVTGEGLWDHPQLMLIGEAPGAQEEAQGRPFVGKAGQNLNLFLSRLGISRGRLWVSNVVKVRPYKVSARGTVSNRPPNRAELEFFTPWLHREIAAVSPSLIVTLGNTALHAVLGGGIVIGDCHGTPVRNESMNVTVFPLYHPASIIYNRSLEKVWDADLDALKIFLSGQ